MASSNSEPFAFVSSSVSSQSIAPNYTNVLSHKRVDVDTTLTKALREHYPELCLTICPEYNAPLLDFAALGYAIYELDTKTDSVFRWRGYVYASERGGSGQLGDAVYFAKYHYKWSDQDYILYTVLGVQYILKEPDKDKDEHVLSNCSATDALIKTCAEAFTGDETDYIWVYDGYWSASRELYEEVQKASWDKVILDSKMKKALQNVTKNFFDSEDVYKRYGVPWRRGLIFYGPPGNGKTISCKALMKELYQRKDPVPTLYVRSAFDTWDIGNIFSFARDFSPCLLVMEDIETIVNNDTRSYFFNEVDGLDSNDGIMMLATTNYVRRLDPGISKRPSRFDRKYRFPLPNLSERTQYSEYWREKLGKDNPDIEFPKEISPAVAKITNGFSFAFLQELFIASLLALAREDQDDDDDDDDDDEDDSTERFGMDSDIDSDGNIPYRRDVSPNKGFKHEDPLEKYRLWRALKATVKVIRQDLKHKELSAVDDEQDRDLWTKKPRSVGFRDQAADHAKPQPQPRPNMASQKQTNLQMPFRPSRPFPAMLKADISRDKDTASKDPDGQFVNPIVRREARASGRLSAGFRSRVGPMGMSRGERMRMAAVPGPSRPRGSVERGHKRRDDEGEPSTSEMYGVGVGKRETFADSAFEYVPIGGGY